MNALKIFNEKNNVKNPELVAGYYKDAFDAMMEGAAMMLDLIGPIDTVYTTKSGNKVNLHLDSV